MLKVPEHVESYNHNLSDCVIFDLDNTIAYHVARSYYEWDKIMTDWCDPRYTKLIKHYLHTGVHVIFLTGRPKDKAEQLSYWWIVNNITKNTESDWELICADEKPESGGSAEAKRLMYNKYVKGKYNVLCSYDDSLSCVEMWREEGILTAQANNGMK